MFCGKFCVFQIVSYQLNHISKDPPTHKKVYSDHLEQYGINFRTFIEKNPWDVPCFPEHVISGDVSLLSSSNLTRITLRPFGVASRNLKLLVQILSKFYKIPSKILCLTDCFILGYLHPQRSFNS
mgnify:CR=1 FL=1